MSREAIAHNPFYVLELPPDCSRVEMERQGQKLLAMLAVGFDEALTYPTPFGRRPRTPEAVRQAMAALREPRRRVVAELWARAPAKSEPGEARQAEPCRDGAAEGWSDARAALGWGPRRSR